MELYFSPLACSLATRIALYESGKSASFVEVDGKTKRTLEDGADYLAVYPLGLVPVLRTDAGELLTENAAILQYVGPTPERNRERLQQWLCFVGTELHKGVFAPVFDKKAGDEVKAWALSKVKSRLDWVASHLEGREFLLDEFSVADAYLFTVLNWTLAVPQIDLKKWPSLDAYVARLRKRPSIAKAFEEELPLYRAEQARHT
jgi:glutathione S-transferase